MFFGAGKATDCFFIIVKTGGNVFVVVFACIKRDFSVKLAKHFNMIYRSTSL